MALASRYLKSVPHPTTGLFCGLKQSCFRFRVFFFFFSFFFIFNLKMLEQIISKVRFYRVCDSIMVSGYSVRKATCEANQMWF